MLKSNLINILLLSSILFIMYLTVFPASILDTGTKPGGINLIPFHTMRDLLIRHIFIDFIINNIGNIILFVPFGFYYLLSSII
ncbi:hypothetical protein F6Y05_02560 [Bacillus megaterium]|nr:hypothetical protein [Priestia megaterium]